MHANIALKGARITTEVGIDLIYMITERSYLILDQYRRYDRM
jgi:hypothetical protein